MYAYLAVTGHEVKAGALTVRAGISGVLEPMDFRLDEGPDSVWTPGGCVFFALKGREYSQRFDAAWYADGTFDCEDADAPLMSYSEADGDYREASAEERALLEDAAGGPTALYWALSKARRSAVEAAAPDALKILKKYIDGEEA
jgi:hypothetical protein